MDLMAAIVSGTVQFFDPTVISFTLVGVLVGIVVGIIPGVGASVALALILPFIFEFKANVALPMLIGAASVTTTSDTITCVLLGIPGTGGSVATVMEGPHLAKRGEASRALSAGFIASAVGGVLGAVFFIISLPIMAPLINKFGAPELFGLAVLGICCVAVVDPGGILKGILSALFGMGLAMIGPPPGSGTYLRFSFDIPYLYSGLPLIVVIMAVFGIPEVFDLVIRGLPIAGRYKLGIGRLQGLKDVIAAKSMLPITSALGSICGMMPGVGTSVANWFGYFYSMRGASPEQKTNYSHGEIRGIIGSESANNACRGGELIPTLFFGVPGSAATAVFLAGMIVVGITPGPRMLTDHMDLVWLIVLALIFGNIIGSLICFFLAQPLALITRVPINYLAPFVLLILIGGAFQSTRDWGDLIVLLGLGFFVWFLKNAGFSRPALIVAFILWKLAERYLHLSLQLLGVGFFWNSSVIIALLLSLVVIFAGAKWMRGKVQAPK